LVALRIQLGESAIGQRLDRALVDSLVAQGKAITRSQLARSFAAGQVRIDGKPAKASLELARACVVEVEFVEPPPLARARPEAIPLTIVHEDDALLVVDKPAGMVVHASLGHAGGTLVNAVLHHLGAGREDLPVLPGNDPERPGIVHRLDRDTSGLLVVAKTAAALAHLAQQFRTHTIERAYLGIVVGVPSFSQRRVETVHGRDPIDRRRFSPEHGERRAITLMTVLEPLADRAARVRFELETGRTHQIRMHARYVGHPIFADPLYGFRPKDPISRSLADALQRHALHAAVLGFEHPDGSRVCFESPFPPELEALATKLQS
jgi:23S rRNA pseudouridine1911/1915/1917 synthase